MRSIQSDGHSAFEHNGHSRLEQNGLSEEISDRAFDAILARFPGTKVLIVGDVMLDEYIWGKVTRISPEAPVQVVEESHRTHAPGGAGNVANNVAGLSGEALLAGVVGSDYSSDRLRTVLQDSGVDGSFLIVDTERPTTTKTRIVAQSQQIARVDSERRAPLPAALELQLLEWAAEQMKMVGCCVLSDYNKGMISAELSQRMIALARTAKKPIIVDPKGTDYKKYRGATIITPNVQEAERATNMEVAAEEDVLRAGAALLELLEGSSVLITRGAEGMSLLTNSAPPIHIPTVARSVYDVTGAGDTVVSTLALALAVDASLEQAARLANRAAGVVVGKLGTARVTIKELVSEAFLASPQNAVVSTPVIGDHPMKV